MNGTATAALPALPNKRDEAWRYAPHVELARLTCGPAEPAVDVPTEIGARDFLAVAKEAMELVEMKQDFLDRAVNAGFSGGEKKRNEILQMAVMQPRLAVLDETDSGLDIDALRVIAGGVNALRGPERSMIVITHYQRLLDYIKPDFVHVLVNGRIVESGDHTLALHLEDHGYADFVNTDLNDAPERPLAGAPS